MLNSILMKKSELLFNSSQLKFSLSNISEHTILSLTKCPFDLYLLSCDLIGSQFANPRSDWLTVFLTANWLVLRLLNCDLISSRFAKLRSDRLSWFGPLLIFLFSRPKGWRRGRRPQPSHPAPWGGPREVWGASQHCHHQARRSLPGSRRVRAVSVLPPTLSGGHDGWPGDLLLFHTTLTHCPHRLRRRAVLPGLSNFGSEPGVDRVQIYTLTLYRVSVETCQINIMQIGYSYNADWDFFLSYYNSWNNIQNL